MGLGMSRRSGYDPVVSIGEPRIKMTICCRLGDNGSIGLLTVGSRGMISCHQWGNW